MSQNPIREAKWPYIYSFYWKVGVERIGRQVFCIVKHGRGVQHELLVSGSTKVLVGGGFAQEHCCRGLSQGLVGIHMPLHR